MLKLLRNLFRKTPQTIIIVSGLPRSGTSMMMKMLEAGGLQVLTDGIREPNEDNPRGYYEFERVKKLPDGDTEWLEGAKGQVIKIISELIVHLPDTYTYKVLFMHRNMEEVLASQNKMLERRRKEHSDRSDEEMARLYNKHLRKVYAWMDQHPNLTYMDVDYNQILQNPLPALEEVNEFLNSILDIGKMAAVVDPSLYRQRRLRMVIS